MTWKDMNQNLSTRSTSQLMNNFVNDKEDILIIQSSSDLGVIRNGGRNGSNVAPMAICNQLSKMAKQNIKKKIRLFPSWPTSLIPENFDQLQIQQSLTLKTQINYQSCFINLGGGHDHIFSFVDAIMDNDSVTIINLDAHLDTRDDAINHSGTPFRQLKNKYQDKMNLIQIGIHDFANASENYQNLDMTIYHMDEVKKQTKNFSNNNQFIKSIFSTIPKDHKIVFSLDADAISAHEMPAVSAVNHDGMPLSFVREFLEEYKENVEKSYIGIYEYNPLFDDLGCASARALASLIYNYIKI